MQKTKWRKNTHTHKTVVHTYSMNTNQMKIILQYYINGQSIAGWYKHKDTTHIVS